LPDATQLRRGDDLNRDKLRQAITAHREEAARLHALEQAQARSQDNVRAARSVLTPAETNLVKTSEVSPQALAYSFVNNAVLDIEHDVKLAESVVERAQTELRQAESINDALEQEIGHVQNRLARRKSDLHEALANLVCDSPAFAQLLKANDEAWHRLRSIRVCFGAIHDIIGMHLPQSVSNQWQLTQPLEDRVGYAVDQQLIGAWREALRALLQDPDAPLPGEA
jgi:hypothetical protein